MTPDRRPPPDTARILIESALACYRQRVESLASPLDILASEPTVLEVLAHAEPRIRALTEEPRPPRRVRRLMEREARRQARRSQP